MTKDFPSGIKPHLIIWDLIKSAGWSVSRVLCWWSSI